MSLRSTGYLPAMAKENAPVFVTESALTSAFEAWLAWVTARGSINSAEQDMIDTSSGDFPAFGVALEYWAGFGGTNAAEVELAGVWSGGPVISQATSIESHEVVFMRDIPPPRDAVAVPATAPIGGGWGGGTATGVYFKLRKGVPLPSDSWLPSMRTAAKADALTIASPSLNGRTMFMS